MTDAAVAAMRARREFVGATGLLLSLAGVAGAHDLSALAVPARDCLAGDVRAFATIDAIERGMVRMVIHRDDGRVELCEFRPGAIARRAADPARHPVSASAPSFFLERGCADAQRVEADDGRLIAWLAYPACRP